MTPTHSAITAGPDTGPPPHVHEHGWRVQSAHHTSEGRLSYVRCDCGARRVDLQAADPTPPVAVSRTIVGRPAPRTQNSWSGWDADGPRSPLR